ncbi:hypothetical protein GGI42DRAFT_104048 [Trichoderma sp. SZMC 28013]
MYKMTCGSTMRLLRLRQTNSLPTSFAPTPELLRRTLIAFFTVVALRDGLRQEHENAWRRLTKSDSFLLHLFDNLENIEPDAKWECKIVDHPEKDPALEAHKIEDYEIVLHVRRPKKADMNPDYIVRDFTSRPEADCAFKQDSEQGHHISLCFDAGLPDYQRRVEAVALFHPLAEPSNPVRLRLPSPDARADKRTPVNRRVQDHPSQGERYGAARSSCPRERLLRLDGQKAARIYCRRHVIFICG